MRDDVALVSTPDREGSGPWDLPRPSFLTRLTVVSPQDPFHWTGQQVLTSAQVPLSLGLSVFWVSGPGEVRTTKSTARVRLENLSPTHSFLIGPTPRVTGLRRSFSTDVKGVEGRGLEVRGPRTRILNY